MNVLLILLSFFVVLYLLIYVPTTRFRAKREKQEKILRENKRIKWENTKAEELDDISKEIHSWIKNRSDIEKKIKKDIIKILQNQYLVEPCSRCYENSMILDEISPTAKSISYSCSHCGKSMRAPAVSQSAYRITEYIDMLKKNSSDDVKYLKEIGPKLFSLNRACGASDTKEKLLPSLECGLDWNPEFSPEYCLTNTQSYLSIHSNFHLNFVTQNSTMPYEQTKRQVISENIRSEVWRRDLGACTKCGVKQNLQFDHIIPVSKGGASSVSNLQLLCGSCNQKKGAKI